MTPTFLTLEEVVEIHRDQIDRSGGAAGIRDLGLSQSAPAQPAASHGGRFLHGDQFEMAVASVLGVATGTKDKAVVASFLRSHAV